MFWNACLSFWTQQFTTAGMVPPHGYLKGPWDLQKKQKQSEMHSPQLFPSSAQSLTKSRGIKTFLMYGRTGSVGICNYRLAQAERYSPVRHTTQFVKLNIHLGLSSDCWEFTDGAGAAVQRSHFRNPQKGLKNKSLKMLWLLFTLSFSPIHPVGVYSYINFDLNKWMYFQKTSRCWSHHGTETMRGTSRSWNPSSGLLWDLPQHTHPAH